MTEEAFFSSAAQKDCFTELDVEQFEVVATLDSHTSEICQDMDGKHFPMSQWEVGTTAPPFHVRCRSTTVPYFDDDFGVVGERAARGQDGKTYFVPADMTYKEWDKAFVQGDKSDLKEATPDDTIKVQEKISDQNAKIDDLKQQFSDITEGYSYDECRIFRNEIRTFMYFQLIYTWMKKHRIFTLILFLLSVTASVDLIPEFP